MTLQFDIFIIRFVNDRKPWIQRTSCRMQSTISILNINNTRKNSLNQYITFQRYNNDIFLYPHRQYSSGESAFSLKLSFGKNVVKTEKLDVCFYVITFPLFACCIKTLPFSPLFICCCMQQLLGRLSFSFIIKPDPTLCIDTSIVQVNLTHIHYLIWILQLLNNSSGWHLSVLREIDRAEITILPKYRYRSDKIGCSLW